MNKDYEKIRCDVLVIGGGGAGLAAAISAARQGVDVLILSKGESGKSGATYYDVAEIGAFNAPESEQGDSPECFYEDIVNASLGVANLKLSRILAERAGETLGYLISLPGGDKIFERNGGRCKVFQSCFTSRPRAHVMKDHFRPLLHVLHSAAMDLGIRTMDGITVAELLVEEGICCGAYGFDRENREVVVLADSVILAAGGAGQLFAHNMYPQDVAGSAYTLAYQAGAEMANLEFVQMGIGVAHPFINLFENYLWECFPILENGRGEEFLKSYLPEGITQRDVLGEKRGHFPFSVRDCSAWVEIAVQKEINAGRGNSRGNVFLRLDTPEMRGCLENQSQFSLMWDTTSQWYLSRGVDMREKPLEIACFAHAVNGGALIDSNGMTSVEGLYAVGEAAAGPHGADRLGGNMSVASQIFGRIAGEHSAAKAKRRNGQLVVMPNMNRRHEFWNSLHLPDHGEAKEVKRTIQRETDRSLLIIRNGEQLGRYMDVLHCLQKQCLEEGGKTAAPRAEIVSLWHMMSTGLLMAYAADARKESRGSHYREDYPELDHGQEHMNVMSIKETRG